MKRLKNRFEKVIFNLSRCDNIYQKYSFHLDYERARYSQDKLKNLITTYLPKFALTEEEYLEMKEDDEPLEIIKKAYSRFTKGNINRKGDFGEVLLYLFLLAHFESEKILTKFLLKTNPQKQVNGFDAIHLSIENDEPIFWLGEVKFHKNFSSALSSIIEEINEHSTDKFLKQEFSILVPHLEINNSKKELKTKVKDLIDFEYSSLDNVKIKIPALITYESKKIKEHTINTEKFQEEIKKEFLNKFNSIDNKSLQLAENIEVIFLIFALEDILNLKEELEDELRKY